MKTKAGPEEGDALPTTTIDLIEVAIITAQEKLASDPVLVDVADHLATVESFLILLVPPERQIRAIAEEILDRVKAECGTEAKRIEGHTGNYWVLIDCRDLVVHILTDEERGYYALGKLWPDGIITHLKESRENSLVLP